MLCIYLPTITWYIYQALFHAKSTLLSFSIHVSIAKLAKMN